MDDDVVSLSNLQRQVIHGTPDVGRPKVDERRGAVRAAQPACRGRGSRRRGSTPENARGPRSRGYDVVADGSDNFETRYAVSDACFFEQKPLVTAALGQFDGIADDDPRP